METNYLLLMGLFLLIVAVDCSSSDPQGIVNETTGLDQNVDGTVDPAKEKVDSKSLLDSIGVSKVKDNGEDQISRSGGTEIDASKSHLNQQSGSNEGENLQKEQKESSAEAKGKSDGSTEGENAKVEEGSNVEDKVKKDSDKEGDNAHNSQEELNVGKGKTNGEKEGDNVQKDPKELNVGKGKTNGEKEGDNVQKDPKESNVAKGKMDSEREGDSVHNGQEESDIEAKGKKGGETEGNNVQKDPKESNDEAKGKMEGEREGDNVHKDQKESNVEAKGKKGGETEGDNEHKGQEELAKGKKGGEKEGKKVDNGQEESKLEVKGKTDDEKNDTPHDNVDPKKATTEKESIEDSIQKPQLLPTRTDGFHGEECDSSNMCMDINKRFAACLRVPGNESPDGPDLSLLIQNKGKGPLNLKIHAPAFVQLEETNIELQEKQDKKVKVSIKGSGTENLIVLKDGNGDCSLDIKDFVVHNSAKSYVNFLSQTPTTSLILIAAILILASGWMCLSFRRRRLTRSGLKYQRLDMELPVSGGAKTEPDVNDGWDNSWGDSWDDEEAPVTPPKPVTPSLSSKGLASRRLSKEGWKD